MLAKDAKSEFERYLAVRGEPDAGLTPERALGAMLAFYREVRAEDCDLAADGDMLLAQWGGFGLKDGGSQSGSQKPGRVQREPYFVFDITRQFIPAGAENDDDEIFQLAVRFKFALSDELRGLKNGNRWCRTPAELAEFEDFIRSQPAFALVRSRTDARVDVSYGQAG